MTKPKRLSLSEIWKVYLLLEPAINGRNSETLFIDEILSLLELSPKGTLVRCLNILYNKLDTDKLNPLELGLLFVRGLKENNFFEFVSFVRTTSNGASR